PLVPLVNPLVSLAGPSPAGSSEPSRLCQRCFPPSPASPGSGCAQLPPDRCDGLARRSDTSLDPQRLTAHRRLVAHEIADPAISPPTPGATDAAPAPPSGPPLTTSGTARPACSPRSIRGSVR